VSRDNGRAERKSRALQSAGKWAISGFEKRPIAVQWPVIGSITTLELLDCVAALWPEPYVLQMPTFGYHGAAHRPLNSLEAWLARLKAAFDVLGFWDVERRLEGQALLSEESRAASGADLCSVPLFQYFF